MLLYSSEIVALVSGSLTKKINIYANKYTVLQTQVVSFNTNNVVKYILVKFITTAIVMWKCHIYDLLGMVYHYDSFISQDILTH